METNQGKAWSYVKGLEKVSFCDWPGKICCVLFLGSCNLRCPTCHNAQLAWYPDKLPTVDKETIFSHINTKKKWLEGIVVSGGEATNVPGLKDFLDALKKFDLPVKLDTNGLRPDILENLLQEDLLQFIAVDVKGPWDKYPRLSGEKCTAQTAKQCLQAIFSMALRYSERFMFRLTKVPILNEADILKTQNYLPKGFDLSLQEYIPVSDL